LALQLISADAAAGAATYAFAGQWGPTTLFDDAGALLSETAVRVLSPGTTAIATLYDSRERASNLNNPLSTNTAGILQFFADPGQYDLSFSGRTLRVTVPIDPVEAAQDQDLSSHLNDLEAHAGLYASPSASNTFTEPQTFQTLVDVGVPGTGATGFRFNGIEDEAPFAIIIGDTNPFYGQQDDILLWGYNRGGGGAKWVSTAPSFGFQIEANVYDQAPPESVQGNYFEWNLDHQSSDATHNQRHLAFRADRERPDLYASWQFQISSLPYGHFAIASGQDFLFEVRTDKVTFHHDVYVVGSVGVDGDLSLGGNGALILGYPGVPNVFVWKNGAARIKAASYVHTPLTLQGAPAQSADLLQVTSSSGMTLLKVRNDGLIATTFISDVSDRGPYFYFLPGQIVLALRGEANFGVFQGGQYGGGAGVIGIANATKPPRSDPGGGAVVYVEGGYLKSRASSGAVFDTSRRAPISNPTGGVTRDAEARMAISTILGVLRADGLIDSSPTS
jgi:hypothetical protein